MARLIRTEKEVEGNYTEQWIVVDEDPVEQWPAGPLELVGQPAAASTAPSAHAGRPSSRPTSSSRDAAHGRPAQPARAARG